MASSAIQKIQELLGDSDEMLGLIANAEAEIRANLVQGIMIDLADFAKGATTPGERAGWDGALEMLKSNY